MATEIKIKNIPTGYQSVISNGKHAVIGDEPISAKGTDLGFSPVEFLLAGISMCKVATIRNVARRKGWEIGNVDANLSQVVSRQDNGTLKTRVESSISIEGNISEEQRALLIKEADNCYVTRMVRGDWEFVDSNVLESIV
ncbi:OsmC family peroxiredoxin [Aquimarina sp. AD10]|uniref:OsmC family protein n=1 Tax=Aquimarina sp. AD10 TaxID=1714849 RepID=UPI000E4707B4|nr:OsmC family protein [Aquimarina sp. AD10]AXT63615.1 OsmC family peroxiredoxin [Aquimarina sp. AD10]RKN00117.1 OsmC family peroxiredoxin [Aquimarina sp. AD10]